MISYDGFIYNIHLNKKFTFLGTNDPANVVKDQIVTPKIINFFRLYRSLLIINEILKKFSEFFVYLPEITEDRC